LFSQSNTSPVTYRCADRLAQAFVHHGVDTVFALSGNQIMPLFDAFNETPIRLVHTRHEAAAVYMAEAYARVSGRLGIALVTAGPGFGNALGALYSASMSEAPVVLISGDAPLSQDGSGAFQQLDQVKTASPLVKSSFRLSAGEDPARVFAGAAWRAQNGIPGPVHIALPCDVVDTRMEFPSLPALDDVSAHDVDDRESLTADQIVQIKELLAAAKRPIILAGPHLFRAARQHKQTALSEALCTPVVVLDSPRGLRDPALGAIQEVLLCADCVLYLGKPVDFTSGFGYTDVMPADTIMVVAGNQAMLDRAEALIKDRLAFSATGNPAALADKFIHAPLQSDPAYTINSVRIEWNKRVHQALHHRQLAQRDADALISRQIVETVERVLRQYPQTILVCDGGEFGQWAQGFTHSNNRLTNGPSGAIGASLPYAIGAKIACPDAPVIAMMGDGTAGFHLAEFETAARQKLAITVLIGNDSRWNAEHLIQLTRYGVDRARDCELSEDVHYETVAQGLGCEGVLVSVPNELHGVLCHSLQSPTTTCINVMMPGAAAPQYTALNLINTHH
jgi:acetolactate synthase-1/2/3 large subunit